MTVLVQFMSIIDTENTRKTINMFNKGVKHYCASELFYAAFDK
jgi:hypothetical protein